MLQQITYLDNGLFYIAPIATFVGNAVGAMISIIIFLVVVMTVIIFIIMRAQRKTRLSKSLILLPCDDLHSLTVSVQTIHWAKEEDDRFVHCCELAVIECVFHCRYQELKFKKVKLVVIRE